MKPGSQTERLLAFLRENPGSSSLEVTLALGIVNVTGRFSDLRAGFVVPLLGAVSLVAFYSAQRRLPASSLRQA